MSIQSDPNNHPPVDQQETFWDAWNADSREDRPLDPESERRGRWVEREMRCLENARPRVLEIGCGTGWLSERLAHYGEVVATDLAPSVIARAQQRVPHVRFIAGDFAEVDLEAASFDVAVCLETLSHVVDKSAFLAQTAALLKPGGHLLITSQNLRVMKHVPVAPLGDGQIRRLITLSEFKRLLAEHFEVRSARLINLPGQRRLTRIPFFPADALGGAFARVGLGKTMVAHAVRH